MKIGTATMNVHRNDTKIFNGFGFKHGDVGNNGKRLRQSVCEGILFYSSLVNGMKIEDPDYLLESSDTSRYISMRVPNEWRDNGIVRKDIRFYRASGNTQYVQVGAYDSDFNLLPGFGDVNSDLTPLIPTVCLLIAILSSENESFANDIEQYSEHISVELLEKIHATFVERFADESVFLSYGNVNEIAHVDVPGPKVKTTVNNIDSDTERFSLEEFPEEFRMLVPVMGKEFVLPDNLKGVCKALVSGDARSVLLHGPAGTGKTISCKLMCQQMNLPLMDTVNGTENLDEFILGKYIPEGNNIVFKESFVTKAIRYGGAVVFEEINFAKPQYLAFLNSLMDDNGMVRLDSGEVIKRHPNFRFFATMNIGYFGTKELNQALYNRFNIIVDVPELEDSIISRMLSSRVPECIPELQHILSIYSRIKNKISSEELDVVISPRNLENWAKLAKYEGYLNAAEKTIIPIARSDKALENGLRGIIRMYKWDRSA